MSARPGQHATRERCYIPDPEQEARDRAERRRVVGGVITVIRILRRSQGLSQSALGRRMGAPRNYVSKIECAASVPSIAQIHKFARALRCPTWRLIQMAEALR